MWAGRGEVKGGGDIQNQGRAGQCSVRGSGFAAGQGQMQQA